MKVIKANEVAKEEVRSRLFEGGTVTRQPLVTAEMSKNFTFGLINFDPGARNIFHTHTSDQILYVTAGEGIVATEAGEVAVRVGDIILIPTGEKHWHGATKDSAFSHISLLASDSKTEY